jgi:serine/threonine protein kinase
MPTFLQSEKGVRYQLGRTLGSGVSCKVKLAKDDANNRFAVKIFGKDIDFGELMSAELDTLRQCAHPNVIGLVESGKGTQENKKKGDKQVHYIVLELAQGGELFDFIALGGRFSEPVARLYGKQLCEALQFMHTSGVCHRDLKPENLMLDGHYNLKVADFGFAAPTAGRDGKSGKLSTQLGTASYMAPEIHLGKQYDGAAVDVLAAGIILFVMVTQRPPFSQASPDDPHYRLLIGKRADLFWNAHAEAEGEDIYSAEFKQLFEGMLAFNPKERWTIAQVLASPWFKKETKTIA